MLSSRKLEAQGINGVESLQFNVPSMVFGDVSGYTFISIRGIGTDVTTTSAEPAVATAPLLTHSAVAAVVDNVMAAASTAPAIAIVFMNISPSSRAKSAKHGPRL